MAMINVKGKEIAVFTENEEDYIYLTDMVREMENGLSLIEKYM